MSNLDVLLITPPSRIEVYQTLSNDYAAIEPPVWSMLIARYLNNLNYDVEILDAEAENFNHEQTAEKIANKNPKLAVFVIYGQQPSASTQCMPAGAKTCNKLNSITNREIKTLVMGTHASALPKRTLEEEPYDFVCQGEGPITISNLINVIKNNKKDYDKVPGLWFRDKHNNIVTNSKTNEKVKQVFKCLIFIIWYQHSTQTNSYTKHSK